VVIGPAYAFVFSGTAPANNSLVVDITVCIDWILDDPQHAESGAHAIGIVTLAIFHNRNALAALRL
jgi:hypothetical protein